MKTARKNRVILSLSFASSIQPEPCMPDQPFPALRVEDLHKSFGSQEVLKGISAQAHKSDVISIIGSSGSGKSTFLRCINFLETPDRGRIAVNGEEIALKMGQDGRLQPRSWRQIERIRTGLGMVFQSFNLWAHRTVLENVIEAPVHVMGMSRREAIEKPRPCSTRSGCSTSAMPIPLSSPAVSSNARRLRERCASILMSCCSTNRLRRSIRSWSARS